MIICFWYVQIAAILKANNFMEQQFERVGYTAFLPTDQAMDAFDGIKDEDFIQAHCSKCPLHAEACITAINFIVMHI